ncbi:hypothetical protein GCM10022276_15350 [Sphingomonas limnosediminicola]|uniref:Uncharacterized protein n=1 Tax=Sphingomonas limnosediminicola TaxID=940133 RepID=A0ABP7LD24_9SPHN
MLQRTNALILIGPGLGDIGFQRLQSVSVLLRLAEEVGHLSFERVEALVESRNRRLRRRRFGGETGRVCGPSAREHLALNLVDLPLEPLDTLFGSDLLPLGQGCGARQQRERGSRQNGNRTQ